jgi:hypothetical protein
MRNRVIIVLLLLAGLAFAGRSALAQVPAGGDDGAVPMGGSDQDVRVRERERMRREYRKLRETRAAALRQAREETAGTAGEAIPGWKGTGQPAKVETTGFVDEKALAVEREQTPVRPLEGLPKFLLYVAAGMLCVVLVVRLRKGK